MGTFYLFQFHTAVVICHPEIPKLTPCPYWSLMVLIITLLVITDHFSCYLKIIPLPALSTVLETAELLF